MYLKSVLQTLATKKQLEAEDLYKLNEAWIDSVCLCATFNVPEEESIDDKMASKLDALGGEGEKPKGNSKVPGLQVLEVVARLEEEHRKLQEASYGKLDSLETEMTTENVEKATEGSEDLSEHTIAKRDLKERYNAMKKPEAPEAPEAPEEDDRKVAPVPGEALVVL
eukprot:Skav204657  [mRNA]  locus=scaffold949:184697:193022:- [translate_table: standard]